MFDIGWGELVLIGLVALIVVGPKELPTVLRTAGQWMGRVKRMASEFQGQFQEALREAEVTDLKQHADDLTGELKSLTDYDPMAGSTRSRTTRTTSELGRAALRDAGARNAGTRRARRRERVGHRDGADAGAEPAASEPAATEEAVTEETADVERAPAARSGRGIGAGRGRRKHASGRGAAA